MYRCRSVPVGAGVARAAVEEEAEKEGEKEEEEEEGMVEIRFARTHRLPRRVVLNGRVPRYLGRERVCGGSAIFT